MFEKELIQMASQARAQAYAPYSGFAVGAALRTSSGAVFIGANVENISYGLTICAERVCVGAAVAAGERDFEVIAIVSESGEPVMPCGACRQVLAEFSPGMGVISSTVGGQTENNALSDLLPHPRKGILG